MLSKLAQDIDFLRSYIVHPNKDLELRVRELEKINGKLREICKILAEDRIVIKKELTDKTRRLGAYAEKVKVLQSKLLQKEQLLIKIAETAKYQKELILSLRDKAVALEIGEKKKEQKLHKLDKSIQYKDAEQLAFQNRLIETKKVLGEQIHLIKKEKDIESLSRQQMQDRLNKILTIIDEQKKLLDSTRNELDAKLQAQKKHYGRLMAELNQNHIREMIDKKALILALKKKMEGLDAELEKRKIREKELIGRFSEKLKEVFNEP